MRRGTTIKWTPNANPPTRIANPLIRLRQKAEQKRPLSKMSQPQVARVYDVEQVFEFVRRQMRPEGLPDAEAALFGRIDNIGPLLAHYRKSGMTAWYIGKELAAIGVKTPNGVNWRPRQITHALQRLSTNEEVLGLLTGPLFSGEVKMPVTTVADKAPRFRRS